MGGPGITRAWGPVLTVRRPRVRQAASPAAGVSAISAGTRSATRPALRWRVHPWRAEARILPKSNGTDSRPLQLELRAADLQGPRHPALPHRPARCPRSEDCAPAPGVVGSGGSGAPGPSTLRVGARSRLPRFKPPVGVVGGSDVDRFDMSSAVRKPEVLGFGSACVNGTHGMYPLSDAGENGLGGHPAPRRGSEMETFLVPYPCPHQDEANTSSVRIQPLLDPLPLHGSSAVCL